MNVIEKQRTRNFFALHGTSSRSVASYPIEYQAKEVPPRRSPHRRRHDGDNIIADLDASGNLVRSYVTPGLDANVSITVHDATTTTYYYNQDERQSVVNLTDAAGVVVNNYAYSAYGDKVDSLTGGDVEQRYTYTGRELSDTTGDFYFRYRWYGAGIGGFMSRDPYEDGYFDGMSMYAGYFAAWMGNDPMGQMFDPALVKPKPPRWGNIRPIPLAMKGILLCLLKKLFYGTNKVDQHLASIVVNALNKGTVSVGDTDDPNLQAEYKAGKIIISSDRLKCDLLERVIPALMHEAWHAWKMKNTPLGGGAADIAGGSHKYEEKIQGQVSTLTKIPVAQVFCCPRKEGDNPVRIIIFKWDILTYECGCDNKKTCEARGLKPMKFSVGQD